MINNDNKKRKKESIYVPNETDFHACLGRHKQNTNCYYLQQILAFFYQFQVPYLTIIACQLYDSFLNFPLPISTTARVRPILAPTTLERSLTSSLRTHWTFAHIVWYLR
jgi:hypothetical protein